MNLKKYQSGICIVAAVALLGAAAFCGYHIYHHYAQVDEQTWSYVKKKYKLNMPF